MGLCACFSFLLHYLNMNTGEECGETAATSMVAAHHQPHLLFHTHKYRTILFTVHDVGGHIATSKVFIQRPKDWIGKKTHQCIGSWQPDPSEQIAILSVCAFQVINNKFLAAQKYRMPDRLCEYVVFGAVFLLSTLFF